MTARKGTALRGIFVRTGALLSGHFQLSSGRHSAQYFQCALVLADPALAERLGKSLAARALASLPRPETVVSPAMGGVIIGHETARALGARSIFAEREDGRMTLRRGFSVRPGERVLVVEDVVTTGKSTGEVIGLLKEAGAEVLGAASIVLRSKKAPDLGVPLVSLARLPAASYDADSCPLCARDMPVTKPGSRFLKGARHADL
jgi:orotate phosphoribosyltransferase